MSNNKIKWLWPVPGTKVGDVTDYRWYTGPHNEGKHSGIDIRVSGIEGYDVVASRTGKVVKILSGCNSYSGLSDDGRDCSQSGCANEIKSYGTAGYYCNDTVGNAVFLKHEFKNPDGSTYYMYSQYCHLKTIDVSMDQEVDQGVKIGTVGSTGMSTGAHLHFSISTGLSYWGGSRINNNPYNVNDLKNSEVDKTDYEANDTIEYFDGTESIPTPEEPEEPEEVKVSVTFKKNTQSDGGPVVETREYVVGQAYESFPSAGTRTGYTFDEWWPEKDSNSSEFTEETSVPAWDHTLYAHWTANTYMG